MLKHPYVLNQLLVTGLSYCPATKPQLNILFFITYCQFHKELSNQIHTLGYLFIKKKWVLNDSVTSIILDVGNTVASITNSILELKRPTSMEQPLGEKLITKHDENCKR